MAMKVMKKALKRRKAMRLSVASSSVAGAAKVSVTGKDRKDGKVLKKGKAGKKKGGNSTADGRKISLKFSKEMLDALRLAKLKQL